MKNKTTILILIATILALGNSCKKKVNKENIPPDSWIFHFYLSDSSGNNILPYDLPASPLASPDSYKAYCEFQSNKFEYGFNKNEEYGHVFYFGDDLNNILNSEFYVKDSIYKIRFCFENKCDTISFRLWAGEEDVIVDHVNGTGSIECGAKWAVFMKDTIFNLSCERLPIKLYSN